MSNYVVYHLHSELSLLDSCTNFREYIRAAKDCGMKALAFSEHGNIYEYYHKKCEIEAAGMKYIHAVEAYITENDTTNPDVKRTRDNYHCVLIARNYEGFLELNGLVSHSFNKRNVKIVGDDERVYYNPRITFDDLIHTSDNIIITTACLGGILRKGNDGIRSRFIEFLYANKHRCFLEIQHHDMNDQREYNVYLEELSACTGIPLIAGTDTHSLDDRQAKGRAMLQKSKDISFPEEDGIDLTFKAYNELVAAYEKQNAHGKSNTISVDTYMTAIENTNVLADMVEEFELTKETKYPKIYENPEKVFMDKIQAALDKHPYVRKRYSEEQIQKTIKEEYDVYCKTKSVDFMLLQVHIREYEKRVGIRPGPGRGSVSGSMIAYILGITEMDSVRFGLNFFRLHKAEVKRCELLENRKAA